MKKNLIGMLGLAALALTACSKPDERIVEVPNGKFKIDIQYREYMKSGTINVDVCVADGGSKGSPTNRGQCFLHGFDFNKISAEWVSDHNVIISFECGNLTFYRNTALITEGREIPDDFNAKLIDTCHTYKWGP